MTEVTGHERILDLLETTAANDRPAHAYLFTGPEGIGKKAVALRFASILNCVSPAEDTDRSCTHCRRIAGLRHPDVRLEQPERGAVRIAQVREVQAYLRFAAAEAKYRTAILDDAHLMNREAQNALLKTLEEPPPGRMLILITAKPSMLLPTVRSRCRTIKFAPLAASEVKKILLEQHGMSAERAETIAPLAAGSVSKALDMDDASFLKLRESVISHLGGKESTGIADVLDFGSSIASDKVKAARAFETAMGWVRDAVIRQTSGDESLLIHRDFLDMTERAAQHHSRDELLRVYRELQEGYRLIEADFNPNRNLVTDVTLLRIRRILYGPTFAPTASPPDAR